MSEVSKPGAVCPAVGVPATGDEPSFLISAAELLPVGKPFECPGVDGSLKPFDGLGDARAPEPLAPFSSANVKPPPFVDAVPREPFTCAEARSANCASDSSVALMSLVKPSRSASAQLLNQKSVRFSDAGAASEAACRRTSAACHSPPRDGAQYLVSGDSCPDPPRFPRVESNPPARTPLCRVLVTLVSMLLGALPALILCTVGRGLLIASPDLLLSALSQGIPCVAKRRHRQCEEHPGNSPSPLRHRPRELARMIMPAVLCRLLSRTESHCRGLVLRRARPLFCGMPGSVL